MREIISIDHIEKKVSKKGVKYAITHALLDDGTEAAGYGLDFKVGDKVEVFFHWGIIKMRKPEWDLEGNDNGTLETTI